MAARRAHRPANSAPLEAHLLDEEFLDWVAAMRKSQASDAIEYVLELHGGYIMDTNTWTARMSLTPVPPPWLRPDAKFNPVALKGELHCCPKQG